LIQFLIDSLCNQKSFEDSLFLRTIENVERTFFISSPNFFASNFCFLPKKGEVNSEREILAADGLHQQTKNKKICPR
jgi:hypothetical protein